MTERQGWERGISAMWAGQAAGMVKRYGGLWEVGGGPWLVLERCTAPRHNTPNYTRRYGCVCPRGKEVQRTKNREHLERLRRSKGIKPRTPKQLEPAHMHRSPLPGGGPWRIIPTCPSRLHNSQRAAREGAAHLRCICPRAIELAGIRRQCHYDKRIEREERQMADSTQARRARRPLWRIGGAPWAVAQDCEAEQHNTLTAARGQRGHTVCICPHAAALLADYRKATRESDKRRSRIDGERVRKPRNADSSMTLSMYFTNVMAGVVPSMPAAACKTEFGAKLADAAYEGRANAEASMKRLCDMCADQPVCKDWVLGRTGYAGEKNPGDWGGVYGGMSVTDRKRERLGITPIAPRYKQSKQTEVA